MTSISGTGLASYSFDFKGDETYTYKYAESGLLAAYGEGTGTWEVDNDRLILHTATSEDKFNIDVTDSELTIHDFYMVDHEDNKDEYGNMVLERK